MIQITDKLLAIYVPNDAYDFQLHNSTLAPIEYTDVMYRRKSVYTFEYILHSGIPPLELNYNIIKIINTLEDITEEEFSRFVENQYCKCKYGSFMTSSHPCKKECQHPKSNKDSLISLLQSKGVDTNKNILLIERL